MHHVIFPDPASLATICHRHHIRRLALFGSTLRGTDRPDSDVDLLVEFESGHKPGLLGLAGIEAELSALAGGRRIDLRTAQDLSRYFRDEVVRTAEVQYAARRCDAGSAHARSRGERPAFHFHKEPRRSRYRFNAALRSRARDRDHWRGGIQGERRATHRLANGTMDRDRRDAQSAHSCLLRH